MAAWTQEGLEQTMLTQREMDVLRLVAKGKTNREIGLALEISEKTVEKHLEGVFAKLGGSGGAGSTGRVGVGQG
jgi:DNA-binding CsgD family transcriptional regulator